MKVKAFFKKAVVQKICFVLISTLIYFLLNLPLKDLQVKSAVTGLRISAFFPVVAGMFMGPYGALGCGLGNVLADMVIDFNFLSIIGFIGNFMLAYLPYKLWHTIASNKSEPTSVKVIFRLVIINAFSIIISMGFISAAAALFAQYGFSNMLIGTTIFNLILGVYGGTSFFMIISELFHAPIYAPKQRYSHEFHRERYAIDYALLGILLLDIGFTFSVYFNNSLIGIHIPLLHSIIIISVILTILPINRSRKKVKVEPTPSKIDSSILAKISLGFFSFSTAYFLYQIIDFISSFDEWSEAAIREYMIVRGIEKAIHTMTEALGLLILLLVILIIIEKRITQPITKISNYAKQLIVSDFKAEKPKIHRASSEIGDLKNSIDKMVSDINVYIKEKQEQIKREQHANEQMQIAKNIQFGILPRHNICTNSFVTSAFIEPAKKVGGDFYDHIFLDDNRLLLCIADVSSKGLPAAMFMSQASMLVKCFKDLPPNQMLEKINNMLYETNSEKMFVTMFLGVVDRQSKSLTFANAGHNYPLIKTDGNFEWLRTDPNPFLGMVNGIEYELHKINFSDDIEIFLYTDGVTEAESANGKFYGDDRLEQIIKSDEFEDTSTDKKVEFVKNDVKSFASGAEQSDDITMVYIKSK